MFTCVIARQVQVFLRTSVPSRALPFTIQYGTPIFLHKAGMNNTNCKQISNLLKTIDKCSLTSA